MVRLGLVAVPVLAACSGVIENDLTAGLSPEEAIATELWVQKALQVFGSERTKCITCHDGSVPAAPAYLGGADDLMRRETLIAFIPRVVNLGAPQSSRMLTVGDHSAMMGGPALLAPEASDILEWVEAEREARPQPPPIRTANIVPQLCTAGNPGDATCPINVVDLAAVGPTPVPGTFEFVVAPLGADSYFTNLKIKAGAEGLYLEHPLLESWESGAAEPTADPIDRFFAVAINLQPNTEMLISTGIATLAGLAATNEVSLRVDVIEKVRPGT